MVNKSNFNYSYYFNQFYDLYNVLNINDNVVVGGTFSLLLHDLNLKDKPRDIDLIIYNPTKEQIEILNFYKIFTINNPVKDKYQRRSYKIKIKDIQVDILLEYHYELPKDLLLFKFKDHYFKIQNIDNVFNAKRLYNRNEIRRKDLIQSNYIKQNNFNILDEINDSKEIEII